jgi:antitoxin CptB
MHHRYPRAPVHIRRRPLYINPSPGPSGLLALSNMTGTTRSSDGLSERRRKLLFRSWHRGIREMDLIMGGFADASIAVMTDADLDELERLLDVPDQEIYSWITGDQAVPSQYDSAFFRRMLAFSKRDGSAR